MHAVRQGVSGVDDARRVGCSYLQQQTRTYLMQTSKRGIPRCCARHRRQCSSTPPTFCVLSQPHPKSLGAALRCCPSCGCHPSAASPCTNTVPILAFPVSMSEEASYSARSSLVGAQLQHSILQQSLAWSFGHWAPFAGSLFARQPCRRLLSLHGKHRLIVCYRLVRIRLVFSTA